MEFWKVKADLVAGWCASKTGHQLRFANDAGDHVVRVKRDPATRLQFALQLLVQALLLDVGVE